MTLRRSLTRTLICATVLLSACTPEQGREWAAINATRERAGHGQLRWDESVGNIAQAHADRLSTPGFPLAHNSNLAFELDRSGTPWLAAAENVGCGPDQFAVFTGYVFSTDHRRNVLSDAWDLVGTGVSSRDGKTCTVQVYVDLG